MRGPPPQLVPVTVFVTADTRDFLVAAANKCRFMGAPGMTTDVLASIALLIGLSGQCMQDGAKDLAHELLVQAQYLADQAGVKRSK